MSPEELSMESFAAQKSSLSGSDTEEKLASSKDSGLRPFMSYYENMITQFIIQEFGDKYVFRFTGMDEENPEERFEAQKLILRVDEMRAERGYEPYGPDDSGIDLGKAPLNPALMAAWQQSVMPEPTEPGQEFGGGPAEDTGDFGSVPGEPASPDAKPSPAATSGSGSDFGSSGKDTVAKAFVYRIGDD